MTAHGYLTGVSKGRLSLSSFTVSLNYAGKSRLFAATPCEVHAQRVGDTRRSKVFTVGDKGAKFTISSAASQGPRLWAVSREGRMAVWDVISGKLGKVQQIHQSVIASMVVMGENIGTGAFDQTARLWRDFEFVGSFKTSDAVSAMGKLDDNTMLIGSETGSVVMVDWTEGPSEKWKQSFCLEGRRGPRIVSVAGDKVGQLVCVSCDDGNVSVWDVRSGSAVQVYGSCGGTAEFCPSGPFVLTTGRIYSLETGTVVFSVEGHKARISHGAWSSDGRSFATSDVAGTVLIWAAPDEMPRAERIFLEA